MCVLTHDIQNGGNTLYTKRLWLLAIVITLSSAVYQRMTGPTYPVRLTETLGGVEIKAKLLRTHSITGDLPVTIKTTDPQITGSVTWRRYMSGEAWQTVTMLPEGQALTAYLPAQSAAGKLEYSLTLTRGTEHLLLPSDEAVVARFKGDVPAYILIPHIFFMFFAMLWSNRAGLEAIVGGPGRGRMALTTLGLLMLGGLILGPIVQKFAFGAYWTGWPFGEDLTDNKLAVAVLAWVWASWRRGDGRWPRATAIIAALIVMAVYMIPHSMHGSTLDYSSMEVRTGQLD